MRNMTTTTGQRCVHWLVLCVSAVSALSRSHPRLAPLSPRQLIRPAPSNLLVSALVLRGGSTTADGGEDDEIESDTTATPPVVAAAAAVDDDDDDDDESLEVAEALATEDPPSTISNEPARILVQTNLGNSVLDHRLELTSKRSKTIGDLKKSISRLLPGRPPVRGLDLVYEGRIAADEMLIAELYDDDEEEGQDVDDEGEEQETFKVLTLNAVPPVDPKFGVELTPKLKSHAEDDEDTLTTEEIVDAYFLNQAAMTHNARLLNDPSATSSPLLRLEIQEQAMHLKERFRSEVPDDVWKSSLEAIKRDHNIENIRGQRYRSGKGGARTSLKKSIQTNLNINWGETIRNCLLLLFFGFFGGRNSFSRTVMLWGAPMCFLLQARPVKMWTKIIFYMLSNPPGIMASLLPAPEQAILNANIEKSFAALYRPHEAVNVVQQETTPKKSFGLARVEKEVEEEDADSVGDTENEDDSGDVVDDDDDDDDSDEE